MTSRPHTRVSPLPTACITRYLLDLAAQVPQVASLIDIGAVGRNLQAHREAAFSGKHVCDVGAHLVSGLCVRDNYKGLDPSQVADLVEGALRSFAKLNRCMFDWSRAVAVDELNELIDAALEGRGVRDAARRWIRTYLLPEDEAQSWDWAEPVEPDATALEAAVLGPMTGLPPDERRQVALLAQAVSLELEERGFHVHCPVASPTVGLSDEEVTVLDMAAITGSAVVVALVPRPALGVGIGVGVAANPGAQPPVLILGPPNTDLSPLTAILDSPELQPACTPEEARLQVDRFLEQNIDRVEQHGRTVIARRIRFRARFEHFRLAVNLETELGLATTKLTPHLKTALCSNIDTFIAAVAMDDEVAQYLVEVENAMATNMGTGGAPAASDATPVEASLGRDDGGAAVRRDSSTGHFQVSSMSWFTSGATEPSTLSSTDQVEQTSPIFEAVGLPPEGHPSDESEQLALFGAGEPVHKAVPRQRRPPNWKEIPLLSAKEVAVGLRAIDRVQLGAEEAQRLIDYAAGLRCDQQLLAAAGGGASYVPLYRVDQWVSMISDMRSQQ